MRGRLIGFLLLSVAVGCRGVKTSGTAAPSALPVGSVTQNRAAFAQAYDWFRHGDGTRALPTFTALLERYPELADYNLYFAAMIDAHLGRDDAAQSTFSRLLVDYPQSVKAPAAALELGKLLLHAGRTEQARPWLQSALASPDASIDQGARLALAQADERGGAWAAAAAGFMTVRRAMPGSALAREAQQDIGALRVQHHELEPAGAEALEEARLLLTERDYAAAKTAADQLSMRAAAEGIDPAALLRVLAEALQGLGQTERALVTLRTLVAHYPDSSEAPEALFRFASLQWNRDQDDNALRAFEELEQRYPHHARTAEAVYASGRIRQQAGQSAEAIRIFADLARRYPQSKVVPDAQWRIGWIHYVDGHWSTAAAAFAQLAQRREGRERAEALYWQGRAEERASRAAAAQRLYERIIADDARGYYAMWAQQRLGGAGLAGSQTVPAAPAPPVLGAPPFSDAFHVGRWEELKAAGVNGLARGELAAIERAHRDDPAAARFLVRAYQTVDGYAAALRLVRRLGEGSLSQSDREQLTYPLAFWAHVEPEAQAHGVDPLLVEAVMRQESMFDPEARSSADARGLLQLLPATAARVANSGDQRIDPADLTQPDLNIQLGVRYLRGLLDRFHGDIFKAVAAYNGGETAVEKWEHQFPRVETDEFVENITYRETRDYVKRVVANYRTYQQLYTSR